jgi:hypothetical protein
LVDEGLLVVFEFFLLYLIDLIFAEVYRFLLLLPNLFDVIDLLLLLVDDDAVLVHILGDDFLDPRVSCYVQYRLALTVLDVDQCAVSKEQNLAYLEETRLRGDMQRTSSVYLLTKLDFGAGVLQE